MLKYLHGAFRRISFVVALMVVSASVCHAEYNKIIDKLEKSLAYKETAADSLAVLANIYDIRTTILGDAGGESAQTVMDLANRAGDTEMQLEMLRYMASKNRQKPLTLDSILSVAESIPDSPHKNETVTFIKNTMSNYYAVYSKQDAGETYLESMLSNLAESDNHDVYDHIANLTAVVQGLSRIASGDLIVNYLDQLGSLIESLPKDELTLRSGYYNSAANIFSDLELEEKSIEADQKLLDNIRALQRYYNEQGRPYRDYDVNKFNIYCRLLSNWENLPDSVIDSYYEKAMKYVEKSDQARMAYEKNYEPDIFYAMNKGDYAKAYPLLKKAVDSKSLRPQRKMRHLKYLIEASQKVGDQQTTLAASLRYNKLLEELLESKVKDKAQELQIVYDTYTLRNKVAENAMKARESVNHMQKMIIIIAIVALLILLIMLVLVVRQSRRSSRLAQTLSEANIALEHESEALKTSQTQLQQARENAEKANRFKTDFLKNLGREINAPLTAVNEYARLIVDCSDVENTPYLQNYADQVEVNCEYLNTIVNDVFHLSEIDSDSVTIVNKLTDLRKIAELAVESVRHRLHEGVKVVFNPDAPNPETVTDGRRLQQIITKLVGNAVKYTENGTIFFDCEYVDEGRTIAISIADNGPGIPEGKQEAIFERFAKVNKNDPGLGIGLSISRMLARLLGGDLKLDPGYTDGARFVLTIPNRKS